MDRKLHLYNTIARKKVAFEPINPPFVGLYVCGPTVYGEPHLGHARSALTFDVVFRYLSHLGFKVRYVRNITDVGHLVNDADAGEDKIGKIAKLEQLEPMEIVQRYTNKYHWAMDKLNMLPPSIEPTATGHIIEQINMIQSIIDNGYGYEINGSVYFDVAKYNNDHAYGKLSGRDINDMMASEEREEGNLRNLDGQDEKKNSVDFALWKKAEPEHIMRWPSPWSDGFPGWHLECSAMSTKYLGKTFDIHGGGMDLLFPHHEAEIAQNTASCGCEPSKYWMHNNMITLDGQKMGKSLGNAINLEEFFTGAHDLLEQAYSPMTIRFFMLQSHYRSTLDFSNDALRAAEKGLARLTNAHKTLQSLNHKEGNINDALNKEIEELCDGCYSYMNDDFNTAMTLANLFELCPKINGFKDGHLDLGGIYQGTFEKLQTTYQAFIEDILGLQDESADGDSRVLDGVMELVIDIRKQSRSNKDWATSDKIRDKLAELNIQLHDGKEGTDWTVENN